MLVCVLEQPRHSITYIQRRLIVTEAPQVLTPTSVLSSLTGAMTHGRYRRKGAFSQLPLIGIVSLQVPASCSPSLSFTISGTQGTASPAALASAH